MGQTRAVGRVTTSQRLELKSHCPRHSLTLSFTKRHDEARRVCTFLNCLSYDAFGSNEKFVSRSPRRMKSEGRALEAFPFVNSFLFNLIFTFSTSTPQLKPFTRNNVRGSGVCTFEFICKGEGKSKLSLNALLN